MVFQQPTSPQQASLLLQLPDELLMIIIELALSSSTPIINPIRPISSRRPFTYFSTTSTTVRAVPELAPALLSTCQLLHGCARTDLLFRNSLIFTRPSALVSFVTSVPSKFVPHIQSLTFSLSETTLLPVSSHEDSYAIPASLLAREWAHLLSCPPPTAHIPGVWCSHLPTLASCTPWLQHLRIDLAGCSRNTSAEMAYLGIKTGYASALESLIAGIGKRGTSSTDIPGIGSGGRLKSLGITGQGAHLWDLGELVRPTVLGEWETIGKWVDLIGRRIVPHLTRAVGGCHVSHRGYKLKRVDSGTLIETSANPMTEAGEDIADAHAKQEYAYISSWAGILWTKNRFSLAGLDEAPTEKTLRSMDYRNAMSWDEIVRMTACQERIGHPVFALFV